MPKAARRRPNKASDSYRPNANVRGYDARWRSASKDFLRRNPLCQEHLRRGDLIPATCVDHIRPHQGNYELFWNERNWQSLCHSCHSRKTVLEDGGLGRERKIPTR